MNKLEALGQCLCLRQDTSYQCRDTDPDSDPYPYPWSGSPPKFNRLFSGPLPTFSENFVQIRSEVCAQNRWQSKRQTTTITYPPWRR